MKLIILLLLLSGLAACDSIGRVDSPVRLEYTSIQHDPVSNAVTIPLFIDKSFGEEDRLSIDNAVDRWNYVLNGYIVLKIKTWEFDMSINDIEYVKHNRGLIIMKVDSKTCDFIPKQKDPKLVSMAWADIGTRELIYIVRDRMETQDLFGVLLHEIGHILGAMHTKQPTLMFPVYHRNMYACIDRQTVKQVSDFNSLPLAHLNYCAILYNELAKSQ